MRLAGRIARLERRRPPGGCPQCGPREGVHHYHVLPPRIMEPGVPTDPREYEPRPEDFCPSCGRQRVFRVRPPKLLVPPEDEA